MRKTSQYHCLGPKSREIKFRTIYICIWTCIMNVVTTENTRKGRGKLYISWHLQLKIMWFSGRKLNTTLWLWLAEMVPLEKYQSTYMIWSSQLAGVRFLYTFPTFSLVLPLDLFNCKFLNNCFLPLSKQNLVTVFCSCNSCLYASKLSKYINRDFYLPKT